MAEELVKTLNLAPHPYGGFFREVQRSAINVKPLTDDRGPRSAVTAIYVVMRHDDINPWHKLKSDETFFYHKGDSLKLYLIDEEGKLTCKIVGDTLQDPNASYAQVVPAGMWFAGEVLEKSESSYVFFTASISPGFHFDDSQLGHVGKLSEMFPEHKELIERLSIMHVHHEEAPNQEDNTE